MELKEYLRSLDIDDEEKLYALSYSNKVKYINELEDSMAKNCKLTADFGYGNVNSNVCILYECKDDVVKYAKLLAKMFAKSGYETWMPYVTFIEKGFDQYDKFLSMELSAVKPKVMYAFCSDRYVDMLVDISTKLKIILIRIPDDATNVDDEASMAKAWKYFRKLINYKNKTHR